MASWRQKMAKRRRRSGRDRPMVVYAILCSVATLGCFIAIAVGASLGEAAIGWVCSIIACACIAGYFDYRQSLRRVRAQLREGRSRLVKLSMDKGLKNHFLPPDVVESLLAESEGRAPPRPILTGCLVFVALAAAAAVSWFSGCSLIRSVIACATALGAAATVGNWLSDALVRKRIRGLVAEANLLSAREYALRAEVEGQRNLRLGEAFGSSGYTPLLTGLPTVHWHFVASAVAGAWALVSDLPDLAGLVLVVLALVGTLGVEWSVMAPRIREAVEELERRQQKELAEQLGRGFSEEE